MVVVILFGFLAVVFAHLSQKTKVPVADAGDGVVTYKYKEFSRGLFLISFLLLAVPCFLCGTGTDVKVYVRLYDSCSFGDLTGSIFEAGYIVSNILLKVFFKNAYVGLGIIKVLSIFLVYRSLYMLRDRLDLGISVLSYVILLYVFNFHLLRMMLALGMVFLALSCEVLGEHKKAVAWIVFALFFHYTAAIVLLAYVVYKWMGDKITAGKLIIFSLALVLAFSFIVPILQLLISAYEPFKKYAVYIKGANEDLGIVQFVLFIPIVFILKITYDRGSKDRFYVLSTVFAIMLFFAGSLGYMIPVVSRMAYYFFWFAMVYFAATPLVDDKYIIVWGKKRVNSTTFAAILYLMMQVGVNYVLNDAFVSNGLTQYTFWWNL